MSKMMLPAEAAPVPCPPVPPPSLPPQPLAPVSAQPATRARMPRDRRFMRMLLRRPGGASGVGGVDPGEFVGVPVVEGAVEVVARRVRLRVLEGEERRGLLRLCELGEIDVGEPARE